jgi:hypothetical protein
VFTGKGEDFIGARVLVKEIGNSNPKPGTIQSNVNDEITLTIVDNDGGWALLNGLFDNFWL